jgi:hypothetical protein
MIRTPPPPRTKYHSDDRNKGDRTEGKCASYGGEVWLVNLMDREHWEGLGVNGKIIKVELERNGI